MNIDKLNSLIKDNEKCKEYILESFYIDLNQIKNLENWSINMASSVMAYNFKELNQDELEKIYSIKSNKKDVFAIISEVLLEDAILTRNAEHMRMLIRMGACFKGNWIRKFEREKRIDFLLDLSLDEDLEIIVYKLISSYPENDTVLESLIKFNKDADKLNRILIEMEKNPDEMKTEEYEKIKEQGADIARKMYVIEVCLERGAKIPSTILYKDVKQNVIEEPSLIEKDLLFVKELIDSIKSEQDKKKFFLKEVVEIYIQNMRLEGTFFSDLEINQVYEICKKKQIGFLMHDFDTKKIMEFYEVNAQHLLKLIKKNNHYDVGDFEKTEKSINKDGNCFLNAILEACKLQDLDLGFQEQQSFRDKVCDMLTQENKKSGYSDSNKILIKFKNIFDALRKKQLNLALSSLPKVDIVNQAFELSCKINKKINQLTSIDANISWNALDKIFKDKNEEKKEFLNSHAALFKWHENLQIYKIVATKRKMASFGKTITFSAPNFGEYKSNPNLVLQEAKVITPLSL